MSKLPGDFFYTSCCPLQISALKTCINDEIFCNQYILCTISLAISYVSHHFCAHLCAVSINFNCIDENRILGK